ncbi:Fatty-acid amide hydrolase 1 [Grifola frondosa]|uniref:Fatty-acid amide hydrolase 1 n=1 Tax=Grifola frondosa TaxID=5627 RepID=A0A1C7MS55_GRIFR|nr:Fatty-acid amide hydrolase 1 [Grifola frondosa]
MRFGQCHSPRSPTCIRQAVSSRHAATNCLADVMFDEAESTVSLHKPLSGIPVSLKDCVDIAGHDTTLGYSVNVNRPARSSAPIVRLLHDAGALVHVKTSVPTGLLSFECSSDLFGVTTNPHNPDFSPGASTGGGAALLVYQGSMVEIGTDLGGSTRYPAAYCGLYAVKGSMGRFPGLIPPTPACTRALREVVDALRSQGFEVIDFHPPSPVELLKIGYQLMFSDGGACVTDPLRTFESISPAIRTVRFMLRLPLFEKKLAAMLLRWFSRPLGRNDAWAGLFEVLHSKSAAEERRLIVQREEHKAAWHAAMREQGLDFILTVPHALPPVPKEKTASNRATLVSANYAFLYNILDYSAGVQPVTFVDEAVDRYPPDYKQRAAYQNMNDVARGVHDLYDAKAMHGLPLAVQVVGGWLQEEKVLEGMKLVEQALWRQVRDSFHGDFDNSHV